MRTDLGPADKVAEGGSTCVTVGARTFALFKVSGTIYCLENQCTHLGGPLCKGKLSGSVIQCPWHGSRFDVRTGAVVGAPARTAVKAFPVTMEGGHVWADVP